MQYKPNWICPYIMINIQLFNKLSLTLSILWLISFIMNKNGKIIKYQRMIIEDTQSLEAWILCYLIAM